MAPAGPAVTPYDFNLTSANANPTGITWDGIYFRVVDVVDDKVYSYDASGVYQSAQDFDLASANAAPTGLTWDGTYFRVLDAQDDKVYSYDASGVYQSAHDFNLAGVSATANVHGLAWDGTYFRVVDFSDDKVYSYDASGVHQSAQDFNLTSANANPRGIAWDGTYLRVVDEADDKVYTYDASGVYQSAHDFDLDSARNLHIVPQGLTWDGTYFRTLDTNNDKVYTYDADGHWQGLGLTSGALAIGAPDSVSNTRVLWNVISPRPLIPATLVAGGGSAYLHFLDINPGLGVVRMEITPQSTGGGGGAGPDLISAWETGGTITLSTGSLTLALDLSADVSSGDTSEPYHWTFTSAARTRANTYCAAVNALAANQRATTVTLEV